MFQSQQATGSENPNPQPPTTPKNSEKKRTPPFPETHKKKQLIHSSRVKPSTAR